MRGRLAFVARPKTRRTFLGEFQERWRANQPGRSVEADEMDSSASFSPSFASAPRSRLVAILFFLLLSLPSLSLCLACFFNRPLSKSTEERKEVFFAVRDDKITLNLGEVVYTCTRPRSTTLCCLVFPLAHAHILTVSRSKEESRSIIGYVRRRDDAFSPVNTRQ